MCTFICTCKRRLPVPITSRQSVPMSSSPDLPAELTLATVAKSTCPESGEYATDPPNAFQAEPAVHVPHEAVEHARSSSSKRSTNWN